MFKKILFLNLFFVFNLFAFLDKIVTSVAEFNSLKNKNFAGFCSEKQTVKKIM